MAGFEIVYEGDLATRCIHSETGTEFLTDAPKDNQGLGRTFSPTDLVAVALGSCTLTIMGIMARKLKVDIKGTRAEVSKKMKGAPDRRIGEIVVEVFCPHSFSPEITAQLEKAASHCPVHGSLHPDLIQTFIYHWGEG